MTVRAVRGATTVDVDEPSHLTQRVQELVGEVLRSNDLTTENVISIIFTATPDIHSKFPAAAARAAGLDDVPLLGAQELDVDLALPLCIRLLAHVETSKSRDELRHVFQHGARVLRSDLVDRDQRPAG